MLQGRHDTYPKRRGMTRVPEMLRHGIRVGFGQDCVLDPWYSLGTADMLDVAFMGLHVAQMSSPADMRALLRHGDRSMPQIMGLDHLGLAVGKRGEPGRARRRRSGRGDPAARRAALRDRPRQGGGRTRAAGDAALAARTTGGRQPPAQGQPSLDLFLPGFEQKLCCV